MVKSKELICQNCSDPYWISDTYVDYEFCEECHRGILAAEEAILEDEFADIEDSAENSEE